jgi:hypothetical protein
MCSEEKTAKAIQEKRGKANQKCIYVMHVYVYMRTQQNGLRWTSAHPRICVDEHMTNSRISVRDVWINSY